jgi:hypothetical protein
MLGLKKNLNLLVDYNPLWEAAFIEERERLSRALGKIAKRIEHYGSTVVPGTDLIAKIFGQRRRALHASLISKLLDRRSGHCSAQKAVGICNHWLDQLR